MKLIIKQTAAESRNWNVDTPGNIKDIAFNCFYIYIYAKKNLSTNKLCKTLDYNSERKGQPYTNPFPSYRPSGTLELLRL